MEEAISQDLKDSTALAVEAILWRFFEGCTLVVTLSQLLESPHHHQRDRHQHRHHHDEDVSRYVAGGGGAMTSGS